MGRIEKLRRLAETYKAEHGPMVGLAFIDKVKDGWEVALLYMKDMTKRGEYLRRRFDTLQEAQGYVDDMGSKCAHMFNADRIPVIIDDTGEG